MAPRLFGRGFGLGDKDRNNAIGFGLILVVKWKGLGAGLPERCAFVRIKNFSDHHGGDFGGVPNLNFGVGPEIINPNGVFRLAAHGTNQNIALINFDTHQWDFSDTPSFRALVGYDDAG